MWCLMAGAKSKMTHCNCLHNNCFLSVHSEWLPQIGLTVKQSLIICTLILIYRKTHFTVLGKWNCQANCCTSFSADQMYELWYSRSPWKYFITITLKFIFLKTTTSSGLFFRCKIPQWNGPGSSSVHKMFAPCCFSPEVKLEVGKMIIWDGRKSEKHLRLMVWLDRSKLWRKLEKCLLNGNE